MKQEVPCDLIQISSASSSFHQNKQLLEHQKPEDDNNVPITNRPKPKQYNINIIINQLNNEILAKYKFKKPSSYRISATLCLVRSLVYIIQQG